MRVPVHVFGGKNQNSAPQSIMEKPVDIYYLDENPIIVLIIDHNSDIEGLRVIDCIVLSAKYWCYNSTWPEMKFPCIDKNIIFMLYEIHIMTWNTPDTEPPARQIHNISNIRINLTIIYSQGDKTHWEHLIHLS